MKNNKDITIKYYEFILELYNISKTDSFAFSPLISKHKLCRNSQTVLYNGGYVEKDGKYWIWVANKPTKLTASIILKSIRDYNSKYNKKYNNSKKLEKSNNLIIKETISLNPLVEQYNKLEEDLKQVTESYSNFIKNNENEIEQLQLKLSVTENSYKELYEYNNTLKDNNKENVDKLLKEINSFREKNLELQNEIKELKKINHYDEEIIVDSEKEYKKIQLYNVDLRNKNLYLESDNINISNKLKETENELSIIKGNFRKSKIMKILAFLNRDWYVNLFVDRT